MTEDTFKCEACMEEFPKAWSDEEMMQEAVENEFIKSAESHDKEEMATVCDDCYKKMAHQFNFHVQ